MGRLVECPYCGSQRGLYSKELVAYDQYYNYDGTPNGYSEFSHRTRRRSTPLYCYSCDKKITTWEKLDLEVSHE